MKNRKRIISTLVGMTLTSQILPGAFSIANALSSDNTNVVESAAQQQQNNLYTDSKLVIGAIRCQEGYFKNPGEDPQFSNPPHKHEIAISFTKDHKLNVFIRSGGTKGHPAHPYYPGQYIRISLIDNKGKMVRDYSMIGTESLADLKSKLDTWTFKDGYTIRVSHAQANDRVTIEGPSYREDPTNPCGKTDISNSASSKISSSDLYTYEFKITTEGLVEVKKDIKEVNNAEQLVKVLKELEQNKKAGIIKLTGNINFDGCNQNSLRNNEELVVPESVTIDGNGKTIDFHKIGSLTLKGNSTQLSNVTIQNAKGKGVQVYNSGNAYLKNVTVKDSEGYGIYANGSKVQLENCTTTNNTSGGILISKSLQLQQLQKKNNKNNIESQVDILERLTQNEKSHQIVIKNLKLDTVDKNNEVIDLNQNAIFNKAPANGYTNFQGQNYKEETKDPQEKTLSDTYIKLLNLKDGTKVTEEIKYLSEIKAK